MHIFTELDEFNEFSNTFKKGKPRMLFLEFVFTFERDCLPYATFSMVTELNDLRQPTG